MAELRRMTVKDLEDLADSDPDANAVWEQRRANNAKKNQNAKEHRNARMAEAPEYAAEVTVLCFERKSMGR